MTLCTPRRYQAIGFLSKSDQLTYPLLCLAPSSNPPENLLEEGPSLDQIKRFGVMEPQIVDQGRTLLGTCTTYAQAKALCKAWRTTKPLRRTMVVFA